MLLWLPWRAAATPGRLALVAPDGSRLSYAELHARADDTALRLATLGLRAGHRLALLVHGGAMFAELAHACMRLGAVLLPLNSRLTPIELAWQVRDAGAHVLVCDGRTAAAAIAVRDAVPGLSVARTAPGDARGTGRGGGSGGMVAPVGDGRRDEPDLPRIGALGGSHGVPLRDRAASDEPLAIVYTSGTTGNPKGVVLTYSNFWWSAMGSALNLGVHLDDRWLAPLPLFHVGGLSVLTRSAIYGTAAVLHDGFDAARVSESIDGDGITLVSLVPTMLRRLLAVRGDRPFPPGLRCVLLGGGPAPRELLERCAGMGVPVAQTYGLTEGCSQVATLAPADALRKLGSAGRALYPTELRVVGEDGGQAAAGEAGEIVVRGPVVTPGYWNSPRATARSIREGWLHTGDVGMLDAEGYLFVLDRRDDLIVTGGENVYPAEVEGVLVSHPAVAEAAVVGVTDAEWGQRVVALVRVVENVVLEPAELREFCAARIARYRLPAEIHLTDEPLPRNAGGKLLRREVRLRLTGGAAGGAPRAD